jgi:hypothetical protein
MSVKESLQKVLEAMPENRLRDILDFAEFLTWQDERDAWRQVGQSQFARAYGRDEPEYTLADIKPDRNK